MDIINNLQAYLTELDEISNSSKNYIYASKVSNLGRQVQILIAQINEFEVYNQALIASGFDYSQKDEKEGLPND